MKRLRYLCRRLGYLLADLWWIFCYSPVLGWEYRVGVDLDLVNITNFPKTCGVRKINNVAARGWQPCLVLRTEAMGFKTTILFKRRKLFPVRMTWKDSLILKRDDSFEA